MTKYFKISLLFLTISLFLLHLFLIDQQNQPNLLNIHFLGLAITINSLWQKRKFIDFSNNLFSTCFGFTLITLMLIRSQMPLGYNPHLSIIIMGIGLSLIASNLRTIKQYQDELLIFLFLFFYPIFTKILLIINLPVITAKISSFLLVLTGFQPQQKGTLISLPTGRIEVYGSCSGVELLIFLMFCAYVLIVTFPLNFLQKISCLNLAIFTAVFTNSLRVGLLAILVAQNNFTAFEYWHGNNGGWLFSIIAVTLFALFNWYLYLKQLIDKLNKHEEATTY